MEIANTKEYPPWGRMRRLAALEFINW